MTLRLIFRYYRWGFGLAVVNIENPAKPKNLIAFGLGYGWSASHFRCKRFQAWLAIGDHWEKKFSILMKPKGRNRNKPCPCGSGKKFKKCCWDAHQLPKQKVEDATP